MWEMQRWGFSLQCRRFVIITNTALKEWRIFYKGHTSASRHTYIHVSSLEVAQKYISLNENEHADHSCRQLHHQRDLRIAPVRSLCAVKTLKELKLLWTLFKRPVRVLASLPALVRIRIKIHRFGTSYLSVVLTQFYTNWGCYIVLVSLKHLHHETVLCILVFFGHTWGQWG